MFYSNATHRARVSCGSVVLAGILACKQTGQQEKKSHALDFDLIRIPRRKSILSFFLDFF